MNRILPLIFLFFFFGAHSQEVHPGYVDGVLYVKFSPQAAKPFFREDHRQLPVNKIPQLVAMIGEFKISKVSRPFFAADDDAVLPNVFKVYFNEIYKVDELLSRLSRQKGIEFVEKVPLVKTSATPNDYSISSASVHLNQINAQQAWNVFNGSSNITVAIVDNAVMWTHADLVANTYTNTAEIPGNGIDDDANGFIDDVNGFDVAEWDNNTNPTNVNMTHGTMCAGIAAARTDNNTGVASIGWNLKLIPVKAEPDLGSTTSVTYGYEGIVYAVRAKARVISCSWGSSLSSLVEKSIIDYAWNRGCIIIAAAGNTSGSTPQYPAAYNHVYAVAGVDQSDVKIGFASFGTWVDISAPGWNIYTTLPYSSTPAYGQGSGSSMAAPMVAGLAGLMLSKSPGMTRTDVLNCISSTAANIYTISGNTSYTNQLGAGRIDAFAAMTCAATFSALPPVANFTAFPPNTCPNTPVQFTDSSLYLPTAWSWTFQGGSPATSTLQNPTVQWSGAGTFSAGLTVTNASGSSSKIKTNYITVAGPIALPFFEGFEQSTFLPSGWTAKNIMKDSMYWERVTGVGGFGSSTACAVFDNYIHSVEGEEDEMLSPKFSFTNVAQAKLIFDVAYARYDQYSTDTLEVRLSTNCGSSWTSIYVKGGSNLATASDHTSFFVPTSTEWRKDTIDISSLAAGQANVMFSFVNRGYFGQAIYLDNINLYFPTPTLSVNNPTAICEGSSVTFTNNSTAATGYTWTLAGGNPSNSSSTGPTVTYTAPGTYTAVLSAVNGTAVSTINKPITVYAIPVMAASGASVCSGHSVTISASGATNYSWSTGASSQSIQVSPGSTTIYTVTGINGGICSSTATTTVTVQVSPTVTASNQTVCPGGTTTLTASGATNYQWVNGPATASVAVTPSANTIYTVTGSQNGCASTTTVNVSLSAPLPVTAAASATSVCSGQAVTLTASGANNFLWDNSTSGASITINPTLTTVYTVTGSVGSCTGMATGTIQIAPTPSLQIFTNPAGPFCSNQTFTMFATGAKNYQWSQGSTDSFFVYTPTLNIPLNFTVTGANDGCSVSIQTIVTVNNDSLNISVSPATASVCAGNTLQLQASGVTSYTWQNGSNNSLLTLSPAQSTVYNVNGSAGNCPARGSATVQVLELPAAILSSTSNACDQICSGAISVQPSGGLPPYTYSLSGSSCNSFPCSQLCEGNYTVHISDANQCRTSSTIAVGSAPYLSAVISGTPNSCAGCSNGVLSATASGGTPPFTYSWSNGVNTAINSGLEPGCYTLQVQDAALCNVVKVLCIDDVTGVRDDFAGSINIYPNPAGEQFTVESDGQQSDLFIYNNLSQLVYSRQDIGSSHRVTTDRLARGAYVVVLRVANRLHYRKLLLE